MRVKSIALTLFSLIIALCLLVPCALGFLVKYQGQAYINLVNENCAQFGPLSNAKWTLSDYQRGWFSSTAHLQYSFQLDKKNYVWPLDAKIFHGPVVVIRDPLTNHWSWAVVRGLLETNVHLTGELAKVLSVYVPANKPVLTTRAAITVLGDIRIDVHSLAIAAAEATSEYPSVIWDGIHLHMRVNHEASKFNGSLDIFPLDVKYMGNQVKSGLIHLAYVGEQSSEYAPHLWLGSSDFTAESFNVLNHGKEIYAMERWAIHAVQGVNEQQWLGAKMNLNLQRVATPTFNIGASHMYWAVHHINPQYLQQMNDVLTEMRKDGRLQTAPQEAFQSLEPVVWKILSDGVVFSLEDFVLHWEQDDIKASGQINFDLKPNETLQSVEDMKDRAHVQLNISLPKAMLEAQLATKFEKEIDNSAMYHPDIAKATRTERHELAVSQARNELKKLQEQGLLTDAKTNYQTLFEIKNEKIILNHINFDMNSLS